MRKLVIAVALGTLLLVAACQRTQPLTSSSASEPTITALAIQRQYDRALLRIDAHPELADQADDLGTTPLMAAVSRSPVPIDFVQGLLKRKVDVNRRDKSGVTALMMASGTGDRATVDLLLKNGADATLQDRRGGTALKRAARFRHSEVPSLLMRHGAKPDIFDAAQLGLAKELEAMLREEPSLARRQGEGGRTALLVAAFAGQKDAVRVLLPYNQPLDACAAAATGRIKELGAALADVAVDTRDPATQMPALECAILAGQYDNMKLHPCCCSAGPTRTVSTTTSKLRRCSLRCARETRGWSNFCCGMGPKRPASFPASARHTPWRSGPIVPTSPNCCGEGEKDARSFDSEALRQALPRSGRRLVCVQEPTYVAVLASALAEDVDAQVPP